VIDELGAILGRDLERAHTAPRAGDVHDSQADQTSLRALVPDIEPTPFAEGLEKTVLSLPLAKFFTSQQAHQC
jgi:UDP-glucose 4-epimerase